MRRVSGRLARAPHRPAAAPRPGRGTARRAARHPARGRRCRDAGHRRVACLVALDHAHAVGLVRRGLGARLCGPHQAEQAVRQAGARAREAYGSWEEFAAGDALGRMPAFDNGTFGPEYDRALHLHRVLTQDPSSPWRGLPFA
ncbi:DUF1266 domain-containing protein [Streptomyces kronopolitis]|uniref:DUF1266 domain-containing protein n=1 Tax=Streptomyces kronopolitis TaxID=1612435 RepID=UPI003D9826AD